MFEEYSSRNLFLTPDELAQINFDNAIAVKAASEAAAAGTGYVLTTGRGGMTVLRGVVDEGQPIGPKDFPSQEAWQTRLDDGWIVPDPNTSAA